MSKTVVRKNESLEDAFYGHLNVQFLKVEQSKKYVNVNFQKPSVKRKKKSEASMLNVNSNN